MNQEILKTIKRALVFIPIFVFIYLSVFFLFSLPLDKKDVSLGRNIIGSKLVPGGWGHSLQRFRDADKTDDPDVLVIGSSHAYRGFDPSVFEESGLTILNLGSSSQSPLNSYYLLKEYLNSIQPKLIIIESYFGVFEDGTGIESFYDISVNRDLSINMAEMAVSTGNPHAINNLLFLYFERLKNPLSDESQIDIMGDIYKNGYNEDKNNNTVENLECIPRYFGINENQLKYFSKSLELAKEHGVPVIAVAHPLPKEKIACALNYEEIMSILKEKANDSGVELIDYSDLMQLDSFEYFKDNNHLNSEGVIEFNKELIKDLTEKDLL